MDPGPARTDDELILSNPEWSYLPYCPEITRKKKLGKKNDFQRKSSQQKKKKGVHAEEAKTVQVQSPEKAKKKKMHSEVAEEGVTIQDPFHNQGTSKPKRKAKATKS